MMMEDEAANNDPDAFDPFVGPSLEQVAAWPKEKLLLRKHDSGFPCGYDCTLLHHALGWGQSPDVCKAMMEKAPELLSMKNARGNVPVVKLQSSMDLSVQRMVVEKTPKEDINHINKEGWTNLGYAIREGADPSVILDLMKKCDDSLFLHKEPGGRLVLHSAARKGAPLAIVREVIRRSGPGALAVEDDEGYLPIHLALQMAQRASLDLIQFLLDETPTEALEGPSKKDGAYLLHRLSVNLPHYILELILDRFPDQINKADADGQPPMHVALQQGAPAAFVSVFVARFPECLLLANRNNQIALHLTPDIFVLELLLEHLPGSEALFWKDKDGLMPIHQFIKTQKPEAMIKVLLDRCCKEEGVNWTDSFGYKALECVLFGDFSCKEKPRRLRRPALPGDWQRQIVKLLLEASPINLLGTYGSSGETLLHAAIQRTWPTTAEAKRFENFLLWLVQQAGQDALNKPNALGMLPLHCLVEQGYSFEHVTAAVCAYPDAVHQQDSKGRLPLFVACPKTSCDLNTIFLFLRMAPALCQSDS